MMTWNSKVGAGRREITLEQTTGSRTEQQKRRKESGKFNMHLNYCCLLGPTCLLDCVFTKADPSGV